jgi:uncharacterized protein YecE (DUF72 family)
MTADLDRLAETLDVFPAEIRVAVEPRHPSWFTEDLRQLLTSRGAALCLADRRGLVTPIWRTAEWTYIRFHAGRATPSPCYGERALESWATRVADSWGQNADGHAYFNNDHRGCALRDAAMFARLLAVNNVETGRRPDPGDPVLGAAADADPRTGVMPL